MEGTARLLLFNPDHGNYMAAEVEKGDSWKIMNRGAWYLDSQAAQRGPTWKPGVGECRTLAELLSVFPRCRVEEAIDG